VILRGQWQSVSSLCGTFEAARIVFGKAATCPTTVRDDPPYRSYYHRSGEQLRPCFMIRRRGGSDVIPLSASLVRNYDQLFSGGSPSISSSHKGREQVNVPRGRRIGRHVCLAAESRPGCARRQWLGSGSSSEGELEEAHGRGGQHWHTSSAASSRTHHLWMVLIMYSIVFSWPGGSMCWIQPSYPLCGEVP
jgi:hypothetical protein